MDKLPHLRELEMGNSLDSRHPPHALLGGIALACALVLTAVPNPAIAGNSNPLRTYSVLLTRVDPKAGPRANFRAEVRAPDTTLAKRTAEAQFPGYRAKHGASLVQRK